MKQQGRWVLEKSWRYKLPAALVLVEAASDGKTSAAHCGAD